ncbi:MAG: hypothetical protein NVS2B16_26890 [Chloroflexota bacterium]
MGILSTENDGASLQPPPSMQAAHAVTVPPASGSAFVPDPTTRMMRYDAGKKSTGVTYLLWFFLAGLGVHRFYLGRWPTGLLVLICTLLGFVLYLPWLVTFGFAILDLFIIPGMVRRHNERLIHSLG